MADWIELSDFGFETIIGILDRERVEPQRMLVDLRLHLDLDEASFGDLSKSVNYADVANQVQFLATEGKWWLLESLASATCALLLADPAHGESRAAIDLVELRLRKPEVLQGQATPGIRVVRAAGWRTLAAVELGPGVAAEVLCVADGVGAYRVHWAPKGDWSPPEGVVGLEICRTAEGGRTALVVARPPL